ncbi:MAG: 4-hydroxy-tetrahydrodipicolinate reductase [Candidatus Diapherotrites archaeon]
MNIALIGLGKMGRTIKQLAEEQKLIIVATIDPTAKDADYKEISKEAVDKADVCIDFTNPSAVMDNIKKLAEFKKNIVLGTTGWNEHEAEVKKIVEESGIGLIYASNFSIGLALFKRIVEDASQWFHKFPEYDVFGYELHHNTKKDSPSGTAKTLAESVLKSYPRKTKAVYEKLDRAPEASELHFASVRGGRIPGTHIIGFDSEADTIELKHTARSRLGFASGALKAAEWVKGKKGFYSIDDMINEMIAQK